VHPRLNQRYSFHEIFPSSGALPANHRIIITKTIITIKIKITTIIIITIIIIILILINIKNNNN
jgi:hypothetical protein